jgi:hypothetical protein
MKTIEVQIYQFNELSPAAKQVAIEQNRKMKYEDYSVVQWAIDNCYLFEPENSVMETLFGEEYTKLTTPVIANTRKNIYFDTDRNRHLDVHQAIEITNEKMFLAWLEIPEQLQEKLFYTITKTYERSPDTIIEFEEGENDYEFTNEENMILKNAAHKFSSHMDKVLKRIEESIEWQFTDECITEDIEANEYEYTADGKQYI